MKKYLLLVILAVLSNSLFALNSYTAATDEGKYAHSSVAEPNISIEFELGTIWGYDFDTDQSGFREIIDLDFQYILNPFTNYKSDLTGIEYDELYGVVEVSGGEIYFEMNNESGDQTTYADLSYKINYELIYGKIVYDPFYLLVAASESGNHYTRNSGWSFSRASSSIRADIAHIGYNVPWEGMNSGFWSIGGASNSVSEVGAGSLLGLGYIFGATEILLEIGSESDWETNVDNEYQLGFMLESNPFGNLTVEAQSYVGLNYEVMPIGFALGTGYLLEISDTMGLTPFVGFDGKFDGTEDNPTEDFYSETSIGATLTWPGSTGWGYEPLNDKDCDRYSGITGGIDIYTQPDFDPKYSITITAYEETSGGLIPMLGSSIIYEINDLTDYLDTDRDYIKMAYGIYLDYNVKDICKPFIRTLKTSGTDDAEITFETGVEFTAIPNASITVGYDSDNINDFDNNKGLLYTEFKVVL